MVAPTYPGNTNDDGDQDLLIAIASLKIALRDVNRANVPLASGFVDLALHYCEQEARQR